MRESFLDTVIATRKPAVKNCIHKTITIPMETFNSLENLRILLNKTASKNVTMAHLLRSVIQYHVEYISDIASLEDLGDKINTEELDYVEVGGLLYTRPIRGAGMSEQEVDTSLLVELKQETIVEPQPEEVSKPKSKGRGRPKKKSPEVEIESAPEPELIEDETIEDEYLKKMLGATKKRTSTVSWRP